MINWNKIIRAGNVEERLNSYPKEAGRYLIYYSSENEYDFAWYKPGSTCFLIYAGYGEWDSEPYLEKVYPSYWAEIDIEKPKECR